MERPEDEDIFNFGKQARYNQQGNGGDREYAESECIPALVPARGTALAVPGAGAPLVLDLQQRGDQGVHRRRHARESGCQPPADLLRADERRAHERRAWRRRQAGRLGRRDDGLRRRPPTEGISVSASRPARSSASACIRCAAARLPARARATSIQCPAKTPPAAGKHCDSVEGSIAHGQGALADRQALIAADVRMLEFAQLAAGHSAVSRPSSRRYLADAAAAGDPHPDDRHRVRLDADDRAARAGRVRTDETLRGGLGAVRTLDLGRPRRDGRSPASC